MGGKIIVGDKLGNKNKILYGEDMELKPCPFCGSKDIKYSVRTSTHIGKNMYYATMFCNKCHCYGPRTLVYPKTLNRTDIENNEEYKIAAELEWNKRR